LLEKYDRGAIKYNKYGSKTHKIHNTRETQIYVVHPVWATSTREIARSFLFIIKQMKGYNLQQNPLLLFLTVSSLKIQYSSSTIAAIHFPHKRGLPSREKNPNIISTIRSVTLK
jgi:hypothetical protein